MNQIEFSLLVHTLASDQTAVATAKPGLCRVWTKEAIRVAQQFRQEHQIQFAIEAREVEIEPFLWHTFLRVISDEVTYLCDGSGTAIYQPYFGLEKDAKHLQNSQIDMIHYLILLNET